MNILTNGGLTIVAVVRFIGTPQDWGRIVDLGNGAGNGNIVVGRYGSAYSLSLALWNGATSLVETGAGSSAMNFVTNSWLTIVARYRSSTWQYSLTVNDATYAGTLPAGLEDRTVSATYMCRSAWSSTAQFFNGDIAGVFVVDEYLGTVTTSAIVDAMVQGVDLTAGRSEHFYLQTLCGRDEQASERFRSTCLLYRMFCREVLDCRHL